ncbi:MAG TPA: heparan-alpha-glucosaminide N-acetyltransferase domain-containing protein [Actinomycetospora sp.]|nr:heparan-alpha-glucosaminide N-acetyltransferase domain-containing protein [Actinomycetospora sp.]
MRPDTVAAPRRSAEPPPPPPPPPPPAPSAPPPRQSGGSAGAVAEAASSPVDEASRPGSRSVGLDAARGVALAGMVAVHSLVVIDAAGSPTVVGQIAQGRSAALFAVLAGVGIALMTGRRPVRGAAEGAAAATTLLTRGLLLGALGLALGGLDAEVAAVILPYYAALFVLAVPLVFLGRWTLLALGVVGAGAIPVASHVLRGLMPPPALDNVTFGALVADPPAVLLELGLTGYYPALSWLPYLCVGMAVGRMRLSSARVAGGLLAGGAVAAAAAWAGSWLALQRFGGLAALQADTAARGLPPEALDAALTAGPDGTTPATSWWWLAGVAPHSSTPPDLVHTAGVAVALLGLMLLLGHVSRPVPKAAVALLRGPLAAVGGLALTLYTAHILFIGSPWDGSTPVIGYVVQVVVGVLFALGWRATAGRGPIESVVTVLSRGAARAVRRRVTARGAA